MAVENSAKLEAEIAAYRRKRQRESSRRWYEKNRERVNAYKRRWNEQNRERLNAYLRNYYAEHREEILERRRRERELRKAEKNGG